MLNLNYLFFVQLIECITILYKKRFWTETICQNSAYITKYYISWYDFNVTKIKYNTPHDPPYKIVQTNSKSR